jgi:Protein of unknown function (DUF1549)/Protein of unknown function (DUF1553)
MWMRNLLFLGTVATGIAALTWLLFPTAVPPRGKGFDPNARQSQEFTGVVQEIDDLFAQAWDKAGLKPAPEAPELAVVRRLALALTGAVPSVQEIRQYEATGVQRFSTEEHYQWWLTGTFEDRRYGDYMAERLARATVGVEEGPPFVYRRHRFTAWLSDQLMQNRPYDALVRELIATDGFSTNKPASNFIISTLDPTNKNTPDRVRLASRTSRAFLGIRLDCAQCHNHPYQPWKKADFDGFAAFYGQVDFGFSGLHEKTNLHYEIDDKRAGHKRVVQPAVPERSDLVSNTGNRRQRLAAWITHKDNPYFARATVNRMWALLFGLPLIEPVDDIATVLLEPLDKLEPADPQRLQRLVLDRLAQDFVQHQFDLRRLITVIAALKVYRLDSASPDELTEAHDRYWAAFPMTRLRSDQVARSLLQACSLKTVNDESNLLTRIAFFDQERKFVERYGDTGEDEFDGRGGTIPQRLLMMNGVLIHERTKEDFNNASSRIAKLSPNDSKAIEVAYLATLTRRPTPEEQDHFEQRLAARSGQKKEEALEDLYWTLLNSTEFAWNH